VREAAKSTAQVLSNLFKKWHFFKGCRLGKISWANWEMRRVRFEKGLQTEKMGRFNPPKPERKCWPTESALEQTMEMHGNKTRTWKTAEARRKKGRLKTTAAILTLSRAENEL